MDKKLLDLQSKLEASKCAYDDVAIQVQRDEEGIVKVDEELRASRIQMEIHLSEYDNLYRSTQKISHEMVIQQQANKTLADVKKGIESYIKEPQDHIEVTERFQIR